LHPPPRTGRQKLFKKYDKNEWWDAEKPTKEEIKIFYIQKKLRKL
jgi:hypothetical protein